ncbi:wall-associated receptor kinase 2-like [Silene latifolia]|uniref:wall-associated receptor kinase 2-like n=1 Tax=Silene latifolia TaxID=37657 RepID=UPI003D778FC3
MEIQNLALKIFITLVLTPFIAGDEVGSPSSLVIAPHCTSKCGNVTIPYPFGIEDGCYFVDEDNPDFYPVMKLTCNDTHYDPPQLILGTNLETLNISLQDPEIRVNNKISFNCYDGGVSTSSYEIRVELGILTLSSTKNKLIATGCDPYAWFYGIRHGESYSIGCMTECANLRHVVDGDCNGIGCCEASLPDAITNIKITVASFSNHTLVDFNPCSVAYPVEMDEFKFKRSNLTQNTDFYSEHSTYPVVFNWGIGTKNCSLAKEGGSCLCMNNTICSDLKPDQDGYRCDCKPGFTGNPYLPRGCKDINECDQANDCEKPEYSTNTKGTYICKCPKGYHGNGTKTHGCLSSRNTWLIPVIIYLIKLVGVGGGIIISLVVGFLLYWRRRVIQLKELRQSFFRQNGGLILSEKHARMDALKIFTAEDLEDATQNYDDMNIIGKGGYGVVYRGLLPNNQHVAIKRSLKVDPNQVEQFINEVLVLSQINNRNVVKLIGCCLETEVPLLVYEFINNGTLYDHLNDDSKAYHVTWQMRLRIASEIAEVLAYLHTTISTPIIHRDMKTMNILLDEYYTAKVADFGASRLCPVDQDQLATMVLGTIGYLDPEYMQTSELTEKSDVYSFGVVLVELLTRKKAVSYQRPEVERCLAMHFLLKMKEDRLFDIVDQNIGNDELEMDQIKDVAELGRWCLRLKGEERPTMKEAAMELDRIKRKGRHPWENNVRQTHEEEREYLLRIDENDDENTGCTDSDLYNPPSFVSPLGGGR